MLVVISYVVGALGSYLSNSEYVLFDFIVMIVARSRPHLLFSLKENDVLAIPQ